VKPLLQFRQQVQQKEQGGHCTGSHKFTDADHGMLAPGIACGHTVVSGGEVTGRLITQVEHYIAAPAAAYTARSSMINTIRKAASCNDRTVQVRPTAIAGVLVFVPKPHCDERGFYAPTFDAQAAAAHGLNPASFAQDSQSRSQREVLRGVHSRSGHGEAKRVRRARGAIHDVVVDTRPDSPTSGRVEMFPLDEGRAVRDGDPDFGITWPFQVSSRDAAAGSWADMAKGITR
jgi:dTDP-4-dehydrorhamnose 3,5-epimerase